MVSLDCTVKRVLDRITVKENNKTIAENSIKNSILKSFDELNVKKFPDFFVDLLVLEKMKELFEEEKESKVVLQRNLTLKEMKFFNDEGIKVYYGDFELFDEELMISDFEDKLYLLDYDMKNSFIYAHAFTFTVEAGNNSSSYTC